MVLLLDDDQFSSRLAAASPPSSIFAATGIRGSAPVRAMPDGRAAYPTPAVRAVLVVDDDQLTAMVIAEQCRAMGIEVNEAYHPRDALRLLAQHEDIEAIISDVRMPVMSGPEMVRRAKGLRPALAIVYVTGYALEDLNGALAPWPVLRKPFDLAELGPALRRAVALR